MVIRPEDTLFKKGEAEELIREERPKLKRQNQEPVLKQVGENDFRVTTRKLPRKTPRRRARLKFSNLRSAFFSPSAQKSPLAKRNENIRSISSLLEGRKKRTTKNILRSRASPVSKFRAISASENLKSKRKAKLFPTFKRNQDLFKFRGGKK